MLRKLLALIAGGEAFSPEDAGRALGTSADAVGGMLAQLAALGYLEEAPSGCSSGDSGARGPLCAGCPSAGSCHGGFFRDARGTVRLLTTKGLAAARDLGADPVDTVSKADPA